MNNFTFSIVSLSNDKVIANVMVDGVKVDNFDATDLIKKVNAVSKKTGKEATIEAKAKAVEQGKPDFANQFVVIMRNHLANITAEAEAKAAAAQAVKLDEDGLPEVTVDATAVVTHNNDLGISDAESADAEGAGNAADQQMVGDDKKQNVNVREKMIDFLASMFNQAKAKFITAMENAADEEGVKAAVINVVRTVYNEYTTSNVDMGEEVIADTDIGETGDEDKDDFKNGKARLAVAAGVWLGELVSQFGMKLYQNSLDADLKDNFGVLRSDGLEELGVKGGRQYTLIEQGHVIVKGILGTLASMIPVSYTRDKKSVWAKATANGKAFKMPVEIYQKLSNGTNEEWAAFFKVINDKTMSLIEKGVALSTMHATSLCTWAYLNADQGEDLMGKSDAEILAQLKATRRDAEFQHVSYLLDKEPVALMKLEREGSDGEKYYVYVVVFEPVLPTYSWNAAAKLIQSMKEKAVIVYKDSSCIFVDKSKLHKQFLVDGGKEAHQRGTDIFGTTVDVNPFGLTFDIKRSFSIFGKNKADAFDVIHNNIMWKNISIDGVVGVVNPRDLKRMVGMTDVEGGIQLASNYNGVIQCRITFHEEGQVKQFLKGLLIVTPAIEKSVICVKDVYPTFDFGKTEEMVSKMDVKVWLYRDSERKIASNVSTQGVQYNGAPDAAQALFSTNGMSEEANEDTKNVSSAGTLAALNGKTINGKKVGAAPLEAIGVRDLMNSLTSMTNPKTAQGFALYAIPFGVFLLMDAENLGVNEKGQVVKPKLQDDITKAAMAMMLLDKPNAVHTYNTVDKDGNVVEAKTMPAVDTDITSTVFDFDTEDAILNVLKGDSKAAYLKAKATGDTAYFEKNRVRFTQIAMKAYYLYLKNQVKVYPIQVSKKFAEQANKYADNGNVLVYRNPFLSLGSSAVKVSLQNKDALFPSLFNGAIVHHKALASTGCDFDGDTISILPLPTKGGLLRDFVDLCVNDGNLGLVRMSSVYKIFLGGRKGLKAINYQSGIQRSIGSQQAAANVGMSDIAARQLMDKAVKAKAINAAKLDEVIGWLAALDINNLTEDTNLAFGLSENSKKYTLRVRFVTSDGKVVIKEISREAMYLFACYSSLGIQVSIDRQKKMVDDVVVDPVARAFFGTQVIKDAQEKPEDNVKLLSLSLIKVNVNQFSSGLTVGWMFDKFTPMSNDNTFTAFARTLRKTADGKAITLGQFSATAESVETVVYRLLSLFNQIGYKPKWEDGKLVSEIDWTKAKSRSICCWMTISGTNRHGETIATNEYTGEVLIGAVLKTYIRIVNALIAKAEINILLKKVFGYSQNPVNIQSMTMRAMGDRYRRSIHVVVPNERFGHATGATIDSEWIEIIRTSKYEDLPKAFNVVNMGNIMLEGIVGSIRKTCLDDLKQIIAWSDETIQKLVASGAAKEAIQREAIKLKRTLAYRVAYDFCETMKVYEKDENGNSKLDANRKLVVDVKATEVARKRAMLVLALSYVNDNNNAFILKKEDGTFELANTEFAKYSGRFTPYGDDVLMQLAKDAEAVAQGKEPSKLYKDVSEFKESQEINTPIYWALVSALEKDATVDNRNAMGMVALNSMFHSKFKTLAQMRAYFNSKLFKNSKALSDYVSYETEASSITSNMSKVTIPAYQELHVKKTSYSQTVDVSKGVQYITAIIQLIRNQANALVNEANMIEICDDVKVMVGSSELTCTAVKFTQTAIAGTEYAKEVPMWVLVRKTTDERGWVMMGKPCPMLKDAILSVKTSTRFSNLYIPHYPDASELAKYGLPADNKSKIFLPTDFCKGIESDAEKIKNKMFFSQYIVGKLDKEFMMQHGISSRLPRPVYGQLENGEFGIMPDCGYQRMKEILSLLVIVDDSGKASEASRAAALAKYEEYKASMKRGAV